MDQLLTIEEVAGLCKVTKGTVRTWERNGKLRCFRTPGGQRRFRLSDVEELFKEAV